MQMSNRRIKGGLSRGGEGGVEGGVEVCVGADKISSAL